MTPNEASAPLPESCTVGTRPFTRPLNEIGFYFDGGIKLLDGASAVVKCNGETVAVASRMEVSNYTNERTQGSLAIYFETQNLPKGKDYTLCVAPGSIAFETDGAENQEFSQTFSVPENLGPARFDVNLRQDFYDKDVVEDSLNRCNVLKINDEEIDLLGCMFGFQGISMQDKCWLLLGKYNLKILILTCGTRGSYVFIPGEMYFRPTPAVKVEDTVGAGDSFTASFISGILKGKTVPEAHRLAVETSAFVCSNKGAMPELPSSLTSL